MLQVLYGHIRRLTLLLHLLLDEDWIMMAGIVLALLFQDLSVGPFCWILARSRLSLIQFSLLLFIGLIVGTCWLLLLLRVLRQCSLVLLITEQDSLWDFA